MGPGQFLRQDESELGVENVTVIDAASSALFPPIPEALSQSETAAESQSATSVEHSFSGDDARPDLPPRPSRQEAGPDEPSQMQELLDELADVADAETFSVCHSLSFEADSVVELAEYEIEATNPAEIEESLSSEFDDSTLSAPEEDTSKYSTAEPSLRVIDERVDELLDSDAEVDEESESVEEYGGEVETTGDELKAEVDEEWEDGEEYNEEAEDEVQVDQEDLLDRFDHERERQVGDLTSEVDESEVEAEGYEESEDGEEYSEEAEEEVSDNEVACQDAQEGEEAWQDGDDLAAGFDEAEVEVNEAEEIRRDEPAESEITDELEAANAEQDLEEELDYERFDDEQEEESELHSVDDDFDWDANDDETSEDTGLDETGQPCDDPPAPDLAAILSDGSVPSDPSAKSLSMTDARTEETGDTSIPWNGDANQAMPDPGLTGENSRQETQPEGAARFPDPFAPHPLIIDFSTPMPGETETLEENEPSRHSGDPLSW